MTAEPAAKAEIQAAITDYWNFRIAGYDADGHHNLSNDAEHEAWTTDLRTLLPAPPTAALDVGARTCFLTILPARIGYDVTAFDPSEVMLAAGRRKCEALGLSVTYRIADSHEGKEPLPRYAVIGVRPRE